jgi:23S rRNA (guanosine2251-2'-O)-methyltransferase
MTTRRSREAGAERPVVYGRNPVREALRGRRRIVRLWGTEPEVAELQAQVTRSAGGGAPRLSIVTPDELTRLCGSPNHQGLVAEAEPYPYADPARLLASDQALVVALDQIQDPQNLGAICRGAECAGATGAVIPERGAAAVTPAVCRASAGAVEHLAVARVRNLSDFLRSAKEAGAWVYGAEAGVETGYTEPDYRGKTVLVLGSEGRGLRPRVRASCDAVVSIPVRGRIGSLNASAAAAVLLYEVVRQRMGHTSC